ncbi:MAG TPA: helix-turn-helix domain-containing protein [Yinghuangia sp.]|nr:helix-turn-helix domain-containing protein [Yinghuangia sp.]
MQPPSAAATAPTSFADKLNHLFETARRGAPGPRTNTECVDALRSAEHPHAKALSASLIAKLRSGEKHNPTKSTIEALATVFGVPAAYFFDEPAHDPQAPVPIPIPRDCHAWAAWTDGLSTQSLQTVETVLRQLRVLEGLSLVEAPLAPQPERSRRRHGAAL